MLGRMLAVAAAYQVASSAGASASSSDESPGPSSVTIHTVRLLFAAPAALSRCTEAGF
jgi:hypothetical protein